MLRPLLSITILIGLLGCSDPQQEVSAPGEPIQTGQPSPDLEAIRANNRGVGLMGQFKYQQAAQLFVALASRYPEWLEVQVNLAIATLNRQREGDEAQALAIAEQVLRVDPENLRAQYVSGLLQLYLTSPDRALPHFLKVAEADPNDAYAAYYLAQCLSQQSQHEQALVWYRKAIQADSYLRSAYYGAFQALQRLRRRDEARDFISDYQRLEANPRARLVEFKYTRMGSKAEALALDVAAPAPVPLPEGAVFLQQQSLPVKLVATSPATSGANRPIGITLADLHKEGRLDLFLTNVSESAGSPNLLLSGNPGGGFDPLPGHPLSAVSGVNAALWGDYDNDGRVDLYLCRQGANQLWQQTAEGAWRDVTAGTGTAGGELNTLDGAFFDADHDGDLDLFLVNADGPNELFNNNLDGSFRPLAEAQGIAGDARGSRKIIAVDIDRDRDTDLIVLNQQPPHQVYLNDRLWHYHPAPGFSEFQSTSAVTGVAADLDSDGRVELYTAKPDGEILRWKRNAEDEFQATLIGRAIAPKPDWQTLAILDSDGDGQLELLSAEPDGWQLIGAGEPIRVTLPEGQRLAALTPALFDVERGPSLIGLEAKGELLIWRPGPGRFGFLAVTLSGREDQAQSMRSNASGIGARLALRVDSRWTVTDSFSHDSGPGQSLQPLAFGLGGASKADFLSIDWSDGVYQTELDLPAGSITPVQETQRQLSSCPVLFVWDGEKYRFITDLLGVGGIGYAVAPGEYAQPRPWENLLLPEGVLQPYQGRYRLKLTEPMEEATYLDSARLVSYDLPPGWQMVLDERMGISGPEPTGQAYYFRHERLPVRAENERGQVVTDRINTVDGRAAPPGRLDQRFIGRLKGEHSLTLSFATPLDEPTGRPLLVLDGWVEYPYSQTSFAAWQAGAGYDAPTLEAQGRDGRWQLVLENFGYPAGMPRRMSVPLNKLPAGTDRLRLRTNQEIYWDRVAVAYAEDLPQVRRHRYPLRTSRVAKTGFAQRTTHPQRRPDYDYGQRNPFWDTRYMAGFYTRLGGDVSELVAETDDALAIFGAGEEIHLEYAVSAPAPAPGWTRRFVLETNGWAKDMDLYTRDGDTLAPLPATGRPREPVARLHARYNNRYQAGH